MSIRQTFIRSVDACRDWHVTRDLARDWRKWTTVERIIAGLIAITPIVAPLFFYG